MDGLAWKMSKEGVHDQFELFGEILEAVVIANKGTDISKAADSLHFRRRRRPLGRASVRIGD